MSPSVEQIAGNALKAHRDGRFDVAEELCIRALESNPNYFKSLVHLAVLLRHKGNFGESASLAERAIVIQPQSVDGYVQLGLCFLGSGRPAEAAEVLRKAIELSPRLAPLYYNLGLALENLGRREEAKASLIEATRLAPYDVTARLSLGSIMLVEEDLRGARAQAEASIKLDPRSGLAHLLKAKVYVAEGMGGKAEECIREALSLDPNSSFGHAMLGFRLLQSGQFEQAEISFKRSIELDEAQGIAYFGITEARKVGEADRVLVTRMERVLHDVPLSLEQASYLEFGLGKAYDNFGVCQVAMNHYDGAHRCAYRARFGDATFDSQEYMRQIEAIKGRYSKNAVSQSGESLDTDLPIFIVGMMRSGTTLTEQILSSHPNVGAAGEQEFWTERAREVEAPEWKIDRRHAVTLARDYCRQLRRIAPGTARVTDKMPGNYLWLGVLHLAMPNAKFIHCRRNPVDTALSIYFTANPIAPPFSHTKEGIVFAYRQYEGLMQHWRENLPLGRLHEVQYEELVTEPERVIRGMLDFLELEWDEACLSHDKNAKEVRTPSLWQVRQPMYTTSVERWRRYEPWLGALRELLEE